MTTAKRVTPDCIDGRCGHPRSEHDDINGVCWGRILTVHDTEAHCPCTTYLLDDEYRLETCSRCGDDPNYCVCTTGWDSVRGMIW
jgi:hypothetical protein